MHYCFFIVLLNSQIRYTIMKNQEKNPVKEQPFEGAKMIFKDSISKLKVVVYEENGSQFMYLVDDRGCEFFIHPGSFQLEEVGQN